MTYHPTGAESLRAYTGQVNSESRFSRRETLSNASLTLGSTPVQNNVTGSF